MAWDAGAPPNAGPPLDDGAPTLGTCSAEPFPVCTHARFTAAEGELCATPDAVMCAPGLFCGDDGLSTHTHRCERAYERDGSCHHAVPEGCPEGQICDGARCVDVPTEGEACALVPSGQSICAEGLGCWSRLVDGGWVSTCAHTLDEGEACGDETLPCARGLWCPRGTCVPISVTYCAAPMPFDAGPPVERPDGDVDA